MTAIRIQINGEQRTVNGETSLRALLESFALSEKRVAIELNGKVVSRNSWPEIMVSDGDRLEVVHFVGGG